MPSFFITALVTELVHAVAEMRTEMMPLQLRVQG